MIKPLWTAFVLLVCVGFAGCANHAASNTTAVAAQSDTASLDGIYTNRNAAFTYTLTLKDGGTGTYYGVNNYWASPASAQVGGATTWRNDGTTLTVDSVKGMNEWTFTIGKGGASLVRSDGIVFKRTARSF